MDGKNMRRQYFIDKKFQIRFIARFSLIVILSSLAIGALIFAFSLNSTTIAIENTKVVVKRTADFILPVMATTLLMVTLFSSLAIFVMTLFFSHKIAGPLYRLRREIEMLKNGNLTGTFTIRNKDQMKELADSLKEMCQTLRQKHAELKTKCDKLREFLKEKHFCVTAEDSDKFAKLVGDIDDILSYFKVG